MICIISGIRIIGSCLNYVTLRPIILFLLLLFNNNNIIIIVVVLETMIVRIERGKKKKCLLFLS